MSKVKISELNEVTTLGDSDYIPVVSGGKTSKVQALTVKSQLKPTFSVGTVTTGAAGSEARVTDSGSAGNTVLNFTIPQGLKGDKGDNGVDGATPVKGTDYFTQTEIDSIVNSVLAKVVDGTEIEY